MSVGPPPALGLPVRSVDVFRAWRTPFRNPQGAYGFGIQDIRQVVDLTIGELETQIVIAKDLERSWAGRIAAVLTFPSRVREAMGLPRDKPSGRVVQISLTAILWVIISTIIATIVGGVTRLVFGF